LDLRGNLFISDSLRTTWEKLRSSTAAPVVAQIRLGDRWPISAD